MAAIKQTTASWTAWKAPRTVTQFARGETIVELGHDVLASMQG